LKRVQVTVAQDVKGALAEVKKKFGRLDAAVNCAGIAPAMKLYNMKKKRMGDLETVRKTLDVCVFAHIRPITVLGRRMPC
uniref:15-hydroxyprostaglandin dehydrogenase n=1 Tax=Toxocara canis TaxID=6265 RepID=A0A183U891_TOXCA